MAAVFLATFFDPLLADATGKVVGKTAGEFRLAAIQFHHFFIQLHIIQMLADHLGR